MAERTSLLPDVDETSIGPDQGRLPPTQHLRVVRKLLAIVGVALAILSIGLLIANLIIISNERVFWSPWFPWGAQQNSKQLVVVMILSIAFSALNILIDLPFLLNMVVDAVLVGFLIASVVGFIKSFPDQSWCQPWYSPPGRTPVPPPPGCAHWTLVSTVLMGITAGFTIIIAAIFIAQLLLRSLAIYKTKSWRHLSLAFPNGEITIRISLKILAQGCERQRVENGERTSYGPVHL